jgi:hypothetical protein
MAAAGALIEMTAERCRTAVLDGPQHLEGSVKYFV